MSETTTRIMKTLSEDLDDIANVEFETLKKVAKMEHIAGSGRVTYMRATCEHTDVSGPSRRVARCDVCHASIRKENPSAEGVAMQVEELLQDTSQAKYLARKQNAPEDVRRYLMMLHEMLDAFPSVYDQLLKGGEEA